MLALLRLRLLVTSPHLPVTLGWLCGGEVAAAVMQAVLSTAAGIHTEAIAGATVVCAAAAVAASGTWPHGA